MSATWDDARHAALRQSSARVLAGPCRSAGMPPLREREKGAFALLRRPPGPLAANGESNSASDAVASRPLLRTLRESRSVWMPAHGITRPATTRRTSLNVFANSLHVGLV